jgi:DNA-directed RNA polymerase subunit RPC12/RpoP
MTYKRYDILTVLVWVILGAALIVLGIFLRRPDFGEAIWWVVMAVGIALAIVGLVSIGFSTRRQADVVCPYCGGKVVPLVKSSTSELYLSKYEEQEAEEEAEEEKMADSAKEGTKGPES